MIQKVQMKKIVLLLLLLFLILFFLFYFRIEKININGCNYYTEEQIKEKIFTSKLEYNSIYLYIKYRYFKAKDIPFIQKVTIERVNNHEVNLNVYEKSLVACIRYMSEYIYFDKDGIVLESSPNKIEEIPYVTGVNFDSFTLYEKLKVKEDGIFDTILELSQLLKQYKLTVDKISFNHKDEVSLTSGQISVLLGKHQFYDEQIATLSSILWQAKEQQLTGVLDMKNYKAGDDVIFKKKEKK